MAMTSTTLSAAFTATQLTLRVAAATGATVPGWAKVDLEYMQIVAINGTAIDVRTRGEYGGVAGDHNAGASVTFGLNSDLSVLGPGEIIPTPTEDLDVQTFDADGAITLPVRRAIVLIRKTSAAALTLAAPSKERNGTMITFVGLTDFAHVVTLAGYDGTTGASTTWTSPAFRGGAATLIAVDGVWYSFSNTLWVIT